MNNERLFLDVHVLQTVPPSCINRDDTGSPKTAYYGGVKRARVSSQSWKRAMRKMFEEKLPEESRAKRTKNIIGMVAKELGDLGYEEDTTLAAKAVLEAAGVKIKETKEGFVREALFFLSNAQARALAEYVMEEPEVLSDKRTSPIKKEAQRILNDTPGIDLSLFGRMVAEKPELNVDACAQVAHSISTHAVSNEFDYFTAVDDYSEQDHAGAGHIGTVEFNSSTLYRYASVALHELKKNVGEETSFAAKEFVRAFIRSMPTGKLNTFANHTLPAAVIVTLRNDQPINLVGAFEKAIRASEDGYVGPSAKALVKHAQNIYNDFSEEPLKTFAVGSVLKPEMETVSIDDALDALEREVGEFFRE